MIGMVGSHMLAPVIERVAKQTYISRLECRSFFTVTWRVAFEIPLGGSTPVAFVVNLDFLRGVISSLQSCPYRRGSSLHPAARVLGTHQLQHVKVLVMSSLHTFSLFDELDNSNGQLVTNLTYITYNLSPAVKTVTTEGGLASRPSVPTAFQQIAPSSAPEAQSVVIQ